MFDKTTNSKTQYTNTTLLTSTNYFRYRILFIFHSAMAVLLTPLQRVVINLYIVVLQLNRLPFRSLPKLLKNIFIIFIDKSLWTILTNKIKNNVNLYYIRNNDHKYINAFWIYYYREQFSYFNEMNTRKIGEKEIANFYYSTAITRKKLTTKKIPLLFYFVNKIAFVNHPYFYWVYTAVLSKSAPKDDAAKSSSHFRTPLFFLCVHTFLNMDSSLSFNKFTLKTFKGVSNFLRNLDKKFNYVTKRALVQDNLLTPHTMYKVSGSKTLSIDIISINYTNFKRKVYKLIIDNNVVNNVKNLSIVWYNKVHNTTIGFKKNNIILFLRAARHFNKGRYSRNRQLYRTGVYWCIWLNVVIVYALHYYFYRVVFAFGYLWLPLALMTLTIFSSRLYKYRYYDVNQIIIEFKEFNNLLFTFFLKARFFLNQFYMSYIYQIKQFIESYLVVIYRYVETRFKLITNLFK